MLKPLNNQLSGLKLVNPPSTHKQGFQQELHHKLELLKLDPHNQDLHKQELHHNQDLHNKGSHKLNMGSFMLNRGDMPILLNHKGESCLNTQEQLKIEGGHKCLHKVMIWIPILLLLAIFVEFKATLGLIVLSILNCVEEKAWLRKICLEESQCMHLGNLETMDQ